MSPSDDLAGQIAELRQRVEALQSALAAQSRVALDQVAPVSYLGQAVAIVATVTDQQSSTPLAGVPVTLFTTWGVLRGDGDVDEGTSFTAQTGSDGKVRVSLRPGIPLDDNEDQDALAAMVGQLDPAAATPNDALATLQTLAQQYRWEANRGFRSALDAYFREIGQKILHAGDFQDYMGSWPLIPVTLIAYVGGVDPGTAPTAATLTMKVRNWLGPWLQVYRQVAGSQIQLDPGLQFIKKNADTANGFVTGLYDHVGLTVDNEFGELGKKVAQHTAQKALGVFLDSGISDLPVDTRVAVGPALATGARSLATAGANVVSALGQNHVTATVTAVSVAGKVDKTDFQTAIVAKANTSDVQTLLAAKADVTTVHDIQGALATKANVTDLQTVQTTLANKADAAAFQAFQKSTSAAIAAKVDAANFETFSKQVSDKLQLTVTKADLDGVRSSFQASLNTKADQTAVDTLRTQTNTALAKKADTTALTATSSRIGALETKVR